MTEPLEPVQDELANFARELRRQFPGFFDTDRPTWIGRAPGRLDVMGGVADYSGSLVLELPLRRCTFAAVQLRSDRRVQVWSVNAEAEGDEPRVALDLKDLGLPGAPVEYSTFQQRVGMDQRTRWVRYVVGGLLVLAREGLLPGDAAGVSIAVASNVPPGAGVSSSAALEVAVLSALAAAYGIALEPLQLALLAQKVENLAVGAPCGVMDQVTASLGKQDALLALLCQPAEVQDYVQLPESVFVCGISTAVKHSVAGPRYRNSRVATFMGRKIIWEAVRAEFPDLEPFGGYLVNVGVREFRRRFWGLLPSRLSGRVFLERYGETGDSVTRVEPEIVYAVRSRTEHAIYEHHRVKRFRAWLERARLGQQFQNALVQAGRLMYASHWSYTRRCGLGAREADLLVREARARGPAKGIYGAKITGGGGGGTVAILARKGAEAEIEALASVYARTTGLQPEIFWGSSDGAAWTPPRRLEAGTF